MTETLSTQAAPTPVQFQTHPDQYRHWRLSVSNDIATLHLDIDEDGGLKPGYKLKLNSYDLGVDIELNDALNRIRYEYPSVRCVVLTSDRPKMFCSGANIYMLGTSTHAWKVNFCKFTNETRNGIEDTSEHSSIKFLAAVNGACAGGGYEMALACDEILMVDDRSSTVSLPEVPLLGVLPGTGGLTRLVDKRRVRRDLADVFCTTAEGVRAERAQQWRLVDHVAKPAVFEAAIQEHSGRLAAQSNRPSDAKGIALPVLTPTLSDNEWQYETVTVSIDRETRTASISVAGPTSDVPADAESARDQADAFWPLVCARELEDAMLRLRTNETDIGLWLLRTRGDHDVVCAYDEFLHHHAKDWFVREVLGSWRRLLSRFDVSSRSMYALIEPGSCFAGILAELAFAADRSYMLDSPEPEEATAITLSQASFGRFPMANGNTRLQAHFSLEVPDGLDELLGESLAAQRCEELGLVTMAPDDLDFADEVRIAIEERVSLSPDALTGLEASLRFPGGESMFTRIFGRLSAWQNWIFIRPNAVGERGALKVYGSGSRPDYDYHRV